MLLTHTNYELIGRGGFGRVFKVFNPLDDQHYAIKQIRVARNNVADALKEIRILASIHHPNIIRYFHSWVTAARDDNNNDRLLGYDDDSSGSGSGSGSGDIVPGGDIGECFYFHIQMEYCPSTLRRHLQQRDTIDTQECFSIVSQVVDGLCFLHANSIVHRDLKPDNILISSFSPLWVKITDFGLARRGVVGEEDASSYTGTSLYAAPEQYTQKRFSTASDIYSLGVLMFEVQHAFRTDMERVVRLQALRRDRDATGVLLPLLILDTTDPDPCRRPPVPVVRDTLRLQSVFVFCRWLVSQVVGRALEQVKI